MDEINQNNSTNSKLAKFLGAVLILLLAGFGFWKMKTKEAPVMTNGNTDQQGVDLTNTPVTNENKNKYRDGSYSAVGKYEAPSGTEQINVTLVLKDGIVSSALVSGGSENSVSNDFIKNFSQDFKTYVVGKSIDAVKLTTVNGSSLTPKGFMDALAKIKIQASA